MQLTKSHSSSHTAGMWGNGSCSVVCPAFLVKSLLLFSRCTHSGPNIALFLTCKTKGNTGQCRQGNESFLIPLAWSHSTGFLLYHSYVQEDGNQLYSWPCHRLWGPISRLPGNSRVHCHLSLVEVAMVASRGAISPHAPCEQCSHERRAPSSLFWHHMLPERLAGCTTVFTASCDVQLPSLLDFFCILCWRGLWLSDKTMDRAYTNMCTLKVHAWAYGKWSRKEELFG